MSKTVLLLGRTEDQLGKDERKQLEEKYGKDVVFETSNTCNPSEHLAVCKRVRPVAVLLPSDDPFFKEAVDEGHQHVVYASGRKGRWGLYVIWRLVRYPFRSFFRTFPAELAYFNNRPA